MTKIKKIVYFQWEGPTGKESRPTVCLKNLTPKRIPLKGIDGKWAKRTCHKFDGWAKIVDYDWKPLWGSAHFINGPISFSKFWNLFFFCWKKKFFSNEYDFGGVFRCPCCNATLKLACFLVNKMTKLPL